MGAYFSKKIASEWIKGGLDEIFAPYREFIGASAQPTADHI